MRHIKTTDILIRLSVVRQSACIKKRHSVCADGGEEGVRERGIRCIATYFYCAKIGSLIHFHVKSFRITISLNSLLIQSSSEDVFRIPSFLTYKTNFRYFIDELDFAFLSFLLKHSRYLIKQIFHLVWSLPRLIFE